jgi:alpha-amylase
MYFALREAFTIPGPANVSAIYAVHKQMKESFKVNFTRGHPQLLPEHFFQDLTVLGNFLENQDNPRWSSISVDPQSL